MEHILRHEVLHTVLESAVGGSNAGADTEEIMENLGLRNYSYLKRLAISGASWNTIVNQLWIINSREM